VSAYFVMEGELLHPVPEARSPWADDMLHGRLLAGLAARAIERDATAEGFRLTRLTVDMFRFPPMKPLLVETRPVRRGGRVHVYDASIMADEVEVARATALLLRTGPHPETSAWRPPTWDVPPPDEIAPPDGDGPQGWDIRLITPGGFWSREQKQLWTRDRWQLVGGDELTPVVRAALAADLPNPLANSGAEGLRFINSDLTLFLARPPVSEWIGLEVIGHLGADGVALGSCRLHDIDGPIGYSTVCAVANTALDVG
jgi:hypothetical protein